MANRRGQDQVERVNDVQLIESTSSVEIRGDITMKSPAPIRKSTRQLRDDSDKENSGPRQNISSLSVDSTQKRRRILTPVQRQLYNERRRVCNLTPQRLERRQVLRRVENLTQDQRERIRASQRVANLSSERVERRNARSRELDMTPTQNHTRRKRQRRESMSPSRIEAINARRRVENMTPRRQPNCISRPVINLSPGQPRNEERNLVPRQQRPNGEFPARDRTVLPPVHNLGRKNNQCTDCKSFHFTAEKTARGKFSSCCASGKVLLKEINAYPKELHNLLSNGTEDSKHFRKNIRKYNSSFAFASFGYKPIKFNSGPPVVIIHGQVHHQTAAALDVDSPKYAQLYFLDPDFAVTERMRNEHNSECRLHVMQTISRLIHALNPYANAFKMMKDFISLDGNCDKTVQMWITKDRVPDPRRYNLPVANEVAVVFVSDDGEPPTNRDIAIYPKCNNNQVQQISQISPNCDPMTYPLLFPHGDRGWQPGIPKVGHIDRAANQQMNEDDAEEETEEGYNSVSLLQFYAFHLQERPTFNQLLHAGKLTQQYIIDAFLKVEGQRLNWNRQNQKALRVDQYLGLMDHVQNQAERQGLRPGRMVILPSTFGGGKRCLQQNYQDAMVMVAKFGKPDLFVTFTCNPKWPEIVEELAHGETAIDRPDLVADVFHLKLKHFLKDMTTSKKGVLGNVKAYLQVIEFQKRGLPHAHMLFILEEDSKPKDVDDIDEMVSAEIPAYSDDPTLFNTISTCMIHGPCGIFNRKAPCMIEEKGVTMCSKKFPKPFQSVTDTNVDGYPAYRRRNDNAFIKKGEHELDNRWVVPYNPYLSRKYNAHINVEICSSVKSVKYIFKYIHKGHDAAIVSVKEGVQTGAFDWDEIQTYLDTRYISSPEAMWRLRKYEMSTRSHAIERLPVHLPSQQTVVFNEGDEERALRLAEARGTKLTKWFQLNQQDEDARKYLYHEIPYHYVWNKNRWKKRQRGGGKILSRMYSVSPKDTERFSLRLLLLTTKGAQSFTELKTVDGTEYNSFKEAAMKRGLLEDDSEWQKVMDEAVVFQMPGELRMLFATILNFGNITNALEMYNAYRQIMMEDYLLSHSPDLAEQLGLRDIQCHLLQFGRDCASFGLPTPREIEAIPDLIDLENARRESIRMVDMMNTEQRTAFQKIMSAIHGETRHKCYFLSGAGGSGKTFVYKAICEAVRGQGWGVKCVAPTGLAATLLPGGKTVHSGFGIPIDLKKNTVSRFKQGSTEWKELCNTKVIIWDEISMCHADLLLAVDRSLRDLLNKPNDPFAGIVVVVGGDFQQQAPVVPHGNRVKTVEACVKSTRLWKSFEELKLIANMRVRPGETEFAEWLLSIGKGVNSQDQAVDFLSIKDNMISSNIVNSVFGSDINELTHAQLASRAILSPKNTDTMKINEMILARLDGSIKIYHSIDSATDCDDEGERANFPTEFLNSLTPMGMPPHQLSLKTGCCVMLLRNLNPKQGLCNGTRLIVQHMGASILECSIFTGSLAGARVFIPRISLDAKHDLPFTLTRKQFPIRLAYSMTITKSQGQTFERIGVYLPLPVFTHGQLYTAFSRVTCEDGLFVEIVEGKSQGKIYEGNDNIFTYNCVYRELLQ